MKIHILTCLCIILLHPPATAQDNQDSIKTYRISLPGAETTPASLDTTVSQSQIHHPLFQLSDSWTDLGNLGLPAIPNTYRKISDPLTPLIFQGYSSYNPSQQTLTFIGAKSPFTLINYNTGGTKDKNGQTINAIYAKNQQNDGNLTLTARYIKSDGHFTKQANNASFMSGNYRTNRKNYKLILGVTRSSFKSGENGGIKNDGDLPGSQPEFLAVNLPEASSKTTLLNLRGIQEFVPGKALRRDSLTSRPDSTRLQADTLGMARDMPTLAGDTSAFKQDTLSSKLCWKLEHRFALSDFYRYYHDADPLRGFYENVYRDSTVTNDSLRFSSWRNEVFLTNDSVTLLGRKLSIGGGLKPDLFRYFSDDSVDYGFSLGIGGYGQWRDSAKLISLAGEFTFAGYSAGDYELTGGYSRFGRGTSGEPQVRIILQSRAVTADPLLRNYYSNHFTWTNKFARQFENSACLAWFFPKINLRQKARIFVNKGWIYFASTGVPVQNAGWNAVFEVATSKTFKAGPFHSLVRATIQKSLGKGLNLPLVTAGTNTYMHHDIRFKSTGGLLEVEYGFDARFCTSFDGYGYMPATGVFTLQDDYKIGNFPYLDAFAMIKVKRTRIFVQWSNALADVLPMQSFGAMHYPYMRPHLKYGVYWHFYD